MQMLCVVGAAQLAQKGHPLEAMPLLLLSLISDAERPAS
jgi:hypothetical protein